MKHNHQNEERQNTQRKKTKMNDKFAKNNRTPITYGTKCPKTDSHDSKKKRVFPLFLPAIRTSKSNQEYIFEDKRWITTSRRKMVLKIIRFEKGLADRGGWRKEIPPTSLFCVLFFLCPLRSRRTLFWETLFAAFRALLVANPLPPTPFRNLW